MSVFEKLETRIKSLDPNCISEERKKLLSPLIDHIQQKLRDREELRLVFICTHNSRRSHLAQVWAQCLAHYFGISNVFCYSAGTEATAMFPMVAKTLESSGFDIAKLSTGNNPVYSIKFAENEHPLIGFSKELEHSFNPGSNFAAITVCSQADEDCPFIAGAEKRFALPFEDPKAFDDTPQQAEKYRERSLEIATEIFYIFSKI